MAHQTKIKRPHNRQPGTATLPTVRLTDSASQWLIPLVVFPVTALVIYVLTFNPVADPDTWFHLALGNWIVDNGKLPGADIFSYTAGDTPAVSSGWLTALLMSWLDGLYPESMMGPILMVTAVVGLASLVILWTAAKCKTLVTTALLLMTGLTLAAVRFSPRPDIWSLLGLTILLTLLTGQWRVGNNSSPTQTVEPPALWRLWLLPLLMVVWANLHAGVLVAVPFLLTYGAWLSYEYIRTRDPAWIKVIIPVAVACVVWMFNPYGTGIATLAWRIAEIPQVGWVMEWMPFFKSGFPNAWPVVIAGLALAAAFIWLYVANRRAFHPLELIWLLMLVVMALMQRRQVGLLGLGATVLLSGHLSGAETWWRTRAPWRSIAAIIALAATIVWVQISGENGRGGGLPTFGRNCSHLPCATADFLTANPPPANIFNSYNLGGYLQYSLYPETKVYIDGRLDTYPHQVWLDMLAVEENRLFVDDLTARYGIKTFVIGTSDSFGDPLHLASRLAARPDFVLVHLDDVAAVFVHKSADDIAYVTAMGFPNISPWNLNKMKPLLNSPEKSQQLVTEMGRLLDQSGLSATAAATAAYIAWQAGDEISMREQLSQAQNRAPGNRLLRMVQQQIARGRK